MKQSQRKKVGTSITFHPTRESARGKARTSGGKVEKLNQGGYKVTRKMKRSEY